MAKKSPSRSSIPRPSAEWREWYEDARYAPESGPKAQACAVPGCDKPAEYRAPKKRTEQSSEGKDYYWFCLDHVSDYNKRYDYFDGMSEAELEAFQRGSFTGHRPTWRMGAGLGAESGVKHPNEALNEKLREFLMGEAAAPVRRFTLKPKYRQALEALKLEWPITPEAVKAAYKTLVKQTHPDLNPGDAEAENRFKQIASAYQTLKKAFEEGGLV